LEFLTDMVRTVVLAADEASERAWAAKGRKGDRLVSWRQLGETMEQGLHLRE
jgi:hypothetical protein